MTLHRPVFTVAMAMLACACAAQPARRDDGRRPATTFRLVNATFDSIATLAIAPAASNDFHPIALGKPLQGGLNATTFRVPAGGCMRDLRITFRDGDVASLPSIDMCRSHALRIGAK